MNSKSHFAGNSNEKEASEGCMRMAANRGEPSASSIEGRAVASKFIMPSKRSIPCSDSRRERASAMIGFLPACARTVKQIDILRGKMVAGEIEYYAKQVEERSIGSKADYKKGNKQKKKKRRRAT